MQKNKEVKPQQSIIPEFISGFSTPVVMQETTKRQASKTLNQFQRFSNNIHGFTLIELLVVVLIIGILAAIALPQYQKAVEKSRAMQAFAQGKYLQQLEELYYLEHGAYTNNFKELGADIPQGFSLSATGLSLYSSDLDRQFTLLQNYNRVLLRNGSPHYALSFNLDTSYSPTKFICTAYQDDNYQAKALCQSLSGQHTDGRRGCNGVCASWLF